MDRLRKFAKTLEKDVMDDLKLLGPQLAEEFHKMLLNNIKNNSFNFKLAASTINSRLARGKGTIPLIDTGEFIKSIVVRGSSVQIRQGVHTRGLSYAELSWILEHGRRDKSVPPFPVWEKTYEQFVPLVQERVNEIFKKHGLM